MTALDRLHAVLDTAAAWTFAVSGGVDSMTLATLAHRHLARPPRMVHASSPAVPSSARPLIDAQARAEGWRLEIIDAGEFSDPAYRANPVNRCYFCKSNLYDSIRAVLAVGEGAVASGTNLDDLGDFRPGLAAAEERGIRHPFVEAGVGKAAVRALAREHGLAFAELPAQPCLASRVETGIGINATDLAFIDRLEAELRRAAGLLGDLRVRLRRGGVAIETGSAADLWPDLADIAADACARSERTFLGVEHYRRGSAFVREIE
jgi:uncharacterized protein